MDERERRGTAPADAASEAAGRGAGEGAGGPAADAAVPGDGAGPRAGAAAGRPRDMRRLLPWMMARMLWTRRPVPARGRVRWRAAAMGGVAALALAALVWLAWTGTMMRLEPYSGGGLGVDTGAAGAGAGLGVDTGAEGAGAATGGGAGAAAGAAGAAGASGGAGTAGASGGAAGAGIGSSSEAAEAALSKDGPSRWLRPAEGRIAAPYGWAYAAAFGDWRLHTGIDFQTSKGAAVVAAADGKVQTVADTRLWGKEVVIDCGGGWTAVYRGLATVAVSEGETVRAGQTIGAAADGIAAESDEGAHLHWEVRHNGEPVDPAPLLTP